MSKFGKLGKSKKKILGKNIYFDDNLNSFVNINTSNSSNNKHLNLNVDPAVNNEAWRKKYSTFGNKHTNLDVDLELNEPLRQNERIPPHFFFF